MTNGGFRLPPRADRLRRNDNDKNMNTLHVNTSDNKKTIISLSGEISDVYEFTSADHRTQVSLQMIAEILKRNKVSLDFVQEVRVVTEMGSFTGVRVGVAIANALGFAKKISVNGLPLDRYVQPQYG